MILHCKNKSMKEILKLLTNQDINNSLQLVYPNFSIVSHICLTLPISTVECERAFSTMRRIKSRLRSQITNATLNHCMKISIDGPKTQDFDFDSAMKKWSRLKNRRIFQ